MGFFRFLGKLTLYAGIFYMVHETHGCIREDSQYSIRRYEGKPYLMDKDSGKIIKIENKSGQMKLGGLEYLTEDALDESRIGAYLTTLKERIGGKDE